MRCAAGASTPATPSDPSCRSVPSPAESTAPQALRRALGRFATGVTIVTCVGHDGKPAGLTVNSFNSLSLDPPLVLWSLRSTSVNLPAFRAAGHFAVNVLAESQVDLSRRFASTASAAAKFGSGAWSPGLAGVPVLGGCAATFECERVEQRDAGDHVLFIGRVWHASEAPVHPLVFQSGRYHLLGPAL